MTRQLKRFAFVFLLTVGTCAAACFAEQQETGTLGRGQAWETSYYVHDTGLDGPTVLVVGGMHGNEPAGARAAEQIRHWPIVRGKLIVVPRANVLGLAKKMRFVPGAPREQRDLNRNFPGERLAEGADGEIAEALWELVLAEKPDWLFDLHEGHDFNISHQPKPGKDKSVGSSIIYRKSEELEPLVRQMQRAVNATVTDPDRKFVRLGRGPKQTGLVSAATRHLKIRGMILETTFNHQRLAVRTRQHRTMMNVALRHLQMIDEDCRDVMAPARKGDQLYIGIYDGKGASEGGIRNVVGIIDKADAMTVAHLGPEDLRTELLSQFDAVVFSGGSGSKQARAIREKGAQAVRAFVNDGGGYVGICGGAYLCSAHYEWSLKLIDTHVLTGVCEVEGQGKKQMWYRGDSATVKLQLTEQGRELFESVPERVSVRYQNGPIVSPKNFPGLAPYETLAYFRSEQVLYPPQKGTMIDTPAIVAAPFGEGRVISVSPHPEATAGLKSMIESALRAVARPPVAESANR